MTHGEYLALFGFLLSIRANQEPEKSPWGLLFECFACLAFTVALVLLLAGH